MKFTWKGSSIYVGAQKIGYYHYLKSVHDSDAPYRMVVSLPGVVFNPYKVATSEQAKQGIELAINKWIEEQICGSAARNLMN